jgi:hypothetical protein
MQWSDILGSLGEGISIKVWCAVVVALAALSIGCGSDTPTAGPAGPPARAEIQADQSEDQQIGLELRDYLVNYCPPPNDKVAARLEQADLRSFSPKKLAALGPISLCYSISTITVEDSRVTIRSGLENDTRGRIAGWAFCLLMYSADVADLTPGHELQGKEGEAIKVCPNDEGVTSSD